MTQPKPLIIAAELQAALNDDHLIILDIRSSLKDVNAGRLAYEEAHIPGAHYCDMLGDVSGCFSGTNGRHPLPDSGRFCVNMRRLGLRPDSHVVVYDDGSCSFAARLWFTLRWVGFENVQVLDGGWNNWAKLGLPVQQEVSDLKEEGTYRATMPLERVFDDDFVEEVLVNHDYTLLDARAHDRFIGATEPIDAKAGHIPGALNAPSSMNIGPDGLFLSPEDLRARFTEALGSRDPSAVINYCGSGVTACCNHLAMEVAGISAAGVYIGSWSEWISDEERPIATGEETGITDHEN